MLGRHRFGSVRDGTVELDLCRSERRHYRQLLGERALFNHDDNQRSGNYV